ncbi:DUF4345 domain-containing protein [Lentisphaera profundi]|uniref:DUF4345 domain-containing protein n=1 Tax=Lentisphaera profundi TaxID=1658616 RepID=A0ABY7VVY3_9BACT|nr:DUF4345 domain-containing protein [Lentisphaera profundi]WDE96223.1 DUF4345 domain-containing protein [Lentisphaera profundi]
MKFAKIFLIAACLGLVPIALGYGLMPVKTMKMMFGLEVAAPNGVHIFRAIMGLYLALVVFWSMGVKNEKFTRPAVYSLIVFMFGLAAGRALSLLVDGVPHWLLTAYMILEIGFGVVGLQVLKAMDKDENKSNS